LVSLQASGLSLLERGRRQRVYRRRYGIFMAPLAAERAIPGGSWLAHTSRPWIGG